MSIVLHRILSQNRSLVLVGLLGCFVWGGYPSLAAGQSDAGQSDAGQSDAGQSEVGPSEVGPSEVVPSEVVPSEVVPSEVGPSEVGPSEVVPSEVVPSEVVPSEVVPTDIGEQRANDRTAALLGSITVFVLALFVGFEVITKVPPTLHTPLMSGSNAISGITLVGSVLTAGVGNAPVAAVLGCLAVILATINVVGGFLVTERMLSMFKK